MCEKKTSVETIQVTCIICPNGCVMQAEVEEGEVLTVTDNGCMRGYAYAQREVTNPTRTFTSTMKVEGGKERLVSVKTQKEIPKDKLMECANELRDKQVRAPIAIGDTLVEDIAQTGVNIVATCNVLCLDS